MRRDEGAVFCTDIASALRDAFIDNNEQTPFFINEGTGREVLVEDASRLKQFRSSLTKDFGKVGDENPGDNGSDVADDAAADDGEDSRACRGRASNDQRDILGRKREIEGGLPAASSGTKIRQFLLSCRARAND